MEQAAPAQHYMGLRSAWFEQMDGDPSDRQEFTIPDRSHDVRHDDTKLADNLWKM